MPKPIFYDSFDLSLSAEDRCKAMSLDLTTDPDYEGADTRLLRDIRLVSADAAAGTTVWEFEVDSIMCNKSGNLHGGAAATIMDNLTSTALMVLARPGFLDGGHVSRTMTMTYLRPVPVGTKVRVESLAVAGGRNTAHCNGVLKTLNGKACVLCSHDKAVLKRATKL